MTMRMNDDIQSAARVSGVRVSEMRSTASGIRVCVEGKNVEGFRRTLERDYGYSVSRGFVDENGYVFDVN